MVGGTLALGDTNNIILTSAMPSRLFLFLNPFYQREKKETGDVKSLTPRMHRKSWAKLAYIPRLASPMTCAL